MDESGGGRSGLGGEEERGGEADRGGEEAGERGSTPGEGMGRAPSKEGSFFQGLRSLVIGLREVVGST